MLSYDDLNASYRRKIASAPVDNDIREDNNVVVPEGANSAIARDEFYNGQTLSGKASYDEAKYELFSFEQKFKLSKPEENQVEFSHHSNGHNGVDENVNSVISGGDGYNDLLNKFKKEHPNINTTKSKITIVGLPSSKGLIDNVANELRKRLGIEVETRSDKNYKPISPEANKSGQGNVEFDVKINISGVHL